jgi:hypothetical protein
VPIEFKCPCGAACSADESKVGQLFHCESCGFDILVPAPGTQDVARQPDPAAATEGISQVQVPAGTVGVLDFGALKEEMAAKAAEGVTEEEVARRQAAREAFQAQLGQKVGADELLEQIHGIRRDAAAPAGAAATSAAREALQAQLGNRAGADEMLEQIHGIRREPAAPAGPGDAAPSAVAADPGAAATSTAEPSDAAAGAGAVPAGPAAPKSATSAAELGKALRLAGPARSIPTGKARAAAHMRIKRIVYRPSLALGALCVAAALYSIDALTLKLIPHRPTLFPEISTLNPQFVRGAEDNLLVFRQGAKHWEIMGPDKEHLAQGKMWAMPDGVTPTMHVDGRMWYQNEYGAEEPAEPADEYLKALNYERDTNERYLGFGIALLAVGSVLLAMGLWTWSDVRIVRREMGTTEIPTAEVAGPEAQAPAGGEPAAAGAAADAAAPPAPAEGAQVLASPAASPEPASAAPEGGAPPPAPAPAGAAVPDAATAQAAASGQGAASPGAAATPMSAPQSTSSVQAGEASPAAPEAKTDAGQEPPKPA